MSTVVTPRRKLRLYQDDGTTNREMLTLLRDPIHRLFSRWVNTNHHVRDFVVAMDHSASAIYADYLLTGPLHPSDEPEPTIVLLQLPDKLVLAAGPRHRFYCEAGTLNISNETLQEQRTVLVPLLITWVLRNYLERDFVSAARDAAVSLCYDYGICQSLGGQLGGGFTAEEFITTPVCPH